MPYEIVKGPKTRSTLRVTGATSGLTLNLSDFAVNTSVSLTGVNSEETVTALTINRAYWSTDSTAHWKVSRNNVQVLQLSSSGFWNLIEGGISVANNSTQNVQIDLVGSSNGTLILEFSKDSTYSPDPGQ